MKKADKARLENIVQTLMSAYEQAQDEAEAMREVVDNERERLEARSDTWQDSDRGQEALEKLEALENVMDSIEAALEAINDADNALNEFNEM